MDGRTALVGLMGWPVEHSLSPVMHNAAFAALGLNWRYVPLAVRPGEIEAAVKGLVALGFRGANVTVPHKEAILPVLSTLTPVAERVGAVNTLVIGRAADGRVSVTGDNTDVPGFIHALRAGGYAPAGDRTALVLGAGGSARAVAYALLEAGEGHVLVLNRTPQRAQALVSELGQGCAWGARLAALALTRETLAEGAQRAGLLVNTTPLGMWPHTAQSPWPEDLPLPAHLTVFDLVYNPLETRLLAQARQAGAQAIDGLDMLVWQGALALALWVNEAGVAPQEIAPIMRAACLRALGVAAR